MLDGESLTELNNHLQQINYLRQTTQNTLRRHLFILSIRLLIVLFPSSWAPWHLKAGDILIIVMIHDNSKWYEAKEWSSINSEWCECQRAVWTRLSIRSPSLLLSISFHPHGPPAFPGSLWMGQRCCIRSLCLCTLGETSTNIHFHISLTRRNFHTHNLIFLFYATCHKLSHISDIAFIHPSPIGGTQNTTSRTWRRRGLIWHMAQWIQCTVSQLQERKSMVKGCGKRNLLNPQQ